MSMAPDYGTNAKLSKPRDKMNLMVYLSSDYHLMETGIPIFRQVMVTIVVAENDTLIRLQIERSNPAILSDPTSDHCDRLEIMLDRAFGSCWTSLLVIFASTMSSKSFMTLSNVTKQDNIIR